MNNLDRAKELKEIKEPKRSDLYWAKYWLNIKKKTGCNNFDTLAKQLKEKVEKGCSSWLRSDSSAFCCKSKGYCNPCQETLKILNEILGEKEKGCGKKFDGYSTCGMTVFGDHKVYCPECEKDEN